MKILASDFDNTIFFERDDITNNKNIESIRRFVSDGNIFCIITGRNYTDLKSYLNKYQIPYTYLICEDGAKIFNNVDYCIDTILLKEEELDVITKILDDNNYKYYLDDGYNKTEYRKDCVKVVLELSDAEEQMQVVALIKKKVNVHVYASRYHVNIINKSVNKENALRRLFNLEDLNLDLLRVIGDNDNDYEMLKAFAGGVIKSHHSVLDELNKKEYETLSDYIEELMKN